MKQGYKQSPLGPIPEDWEVKRLGDLCFDIFSGSNKTRIDSGKYTVYGSTGVIGKTDEYKYEGERILVARVGAHAGQVSIASGKYDVSDNTIIVENQDCYSLYFAYQYLISSNLNKMVFGSGQPLITAGMLKRMFVVYPPFEEQLKINNVLQLWDTAIAKQTALIEKLTLRKRGLMQQLLTGKKRLKGFGGEWKEVRLGEVLNRLSNGFTYDTTTTHGYKITRIETISDGSINTSKVGFSEEIPAKEYRLTKGDILYSHINSLAHIGKVAFYDIDDEIYHGMNLLLLRTNEKVYNRFLYYLLLTDLFKNYAVKYAKPAVNQASISTSDIRHFCFCIPTIKEQMEIVKIIENADKEIEIQKQKLAAMQAQKKGLMQVLLSGKKRIK